VPDRVSKGWVSVGNRGSFLLRVGSLGVAPTAYWGRPTSLMSLFLRSVSPFCVSIRIWCRLTDVRFRPGPGDQLFKWVLPAACHSDGSSPPERNPPRSQRVRGPTRSLRSNFVSFLRRPVEKFSKHFLKLNCNSTLFARPGFFFFFFLVIELRGPKPIREGWHPPALRQRKSGERLGAFRPGRNGAGGR